MASTRSKTGNSKPRVFPATETTTPAARKPATKKSGPKATKAKANTSKPRAKKVAQDKVTKVKKTAKKAAAATTAPKKKSAAAPKKEEAPAAVAAPVAAPAAADAPAVREPTLLESVSEKVSGALLKVEGVLSGKPGKKAAGTAKINKSTAKKPVAKKA